jgi:putative N6-adenine-specific DNA methylase
MKEELFITCPWGLETLLLQELEELGLQGRKGSAGVYLPKEMRSVYLVNYSSRIATRVLWPMARFRCPNSEELYRAVREIDWSELLTVDKTFAIDANVSHPNIKNSLYASLVVKDAICDRMRDSFGERPSVNVSEPDVQLNLFIQNGVASLSFDTSGPPLYKRGWREQTGEAPLQESLAATILSLAGYRGEGILCDPFCGSGTFLVEAAMIASKTPPGYFRQKWGFLYHPRYSQEEWEKVKEEANAKRVALSKVQFLGADKDPQAIASCQHHFDKLGYPNAVFLERRGIASYLPPTPPKMIVTNPPYGKRLHTSAEHFKALGKLANNTPTFLLAPNSSFAKATGKMIQKETPLKNGGLEISLFQI